MTTYIDKKTNNKINNEDIIYNNKNIVYKTDSCWKLLEEDNIKTNNNELKIKEESPVTLKEINTPDKILDTNIDSSYTEKIRYYFGIKNLSFSKKILNTNSAIISKNINVKDYSYISIDVNEINLENTGVEYSIIDSLEEIPILPLSLEYVKLEKLFYNIPTRFKIKEIISLYENGVKVNKDYNDLTFEDFENNQYNLSYIPYRDIYKYSHKNDYIKLKIVFRNLVANKINGYIDNIHLNKYGGSLY